jgi:hypothetical protein
MAVLLVLMDIAVSPAKLIHMCFYNLNASNVINLIQDALIVLILRYAPFVLKIISPKQVTAWVVTTTLQVAINATILLRV